MRRLQENSALMTWTAICLIGGVTGSIVGGVLGRLIGVT